MLQDVSMPAERSSQFTSLSWHVFLNTPKERSARQVLSRIERLLEVEIEVVSMQRYWKIDTLYDVRFRSPVHATDPRDAVWLLLTTAQRLTHGYCTSGPSTYQGGGVEMSLLSDSGFVDPGIHWLSVEVGNLEASPTSLD